MELPGLGEFNVDRNYPGPCPNCCAPFNCSAGADATNLNLTINWDFCACDPTAFYGAGTFIFFTGTSGGSFNLRGPAGGPWVITIPGALTATQWIIAPDPDTGDLVCTLGPDSPTTVDLVLQISCSVFGFTIIASTPDDPTFFLSAGHSPTQFNSIPACSPGDNSYGIGGMAIVSS